MMFGLTTHVEIHTAEIMLTLILIRINNAFGISVSMKWACTTFLQLYNSYRKRLEVKKLHS